MKKYYETLGLNEDATLEEVNNAFSRISMELYNQRISGKINAAEYKDRFEEIELAHSTIVEHAKAVAAEKAKAVVVETTEEKKESTKKDQKVVVTEKTKEQPKVEENEKDPARGWRIATGVVTVALIISLFAGGLKGCSKLAEETGAYITGRPAATETLNDDPTKTEETQAEEPTVQETPAEETTTQEDYSDRQVVVDLGDVEDDTLVRARAQELTDQLSAAGIVDPNTTVPYTVDQIFALIKYANGVYTPETMEEIDVLHLNLLNLLISPINTDDYLYHVVFANGDDSFNNLLNSNPTHVTFGEAFAAYGENGIYPLVQWFEQKRMEIYSATDRETVNAIYREVGQVMADLMKGNGCTITLYDGKDAKEGIEYHFTSEQVLSQHSSAMIITTEFQLIMANHYEKRNGVGEIVDEVPQTWEVYNKLNADGVDDNGQPIINPDIVTYDEMNAWVNNGCDYEWEIDSVLINGQTFGQRIQGDMEGMAQNNYAMTHDGSLKK